MTKLLSIVSNIVWVVDGQGNALAPNKTWEETTGMRWPDYAGRGWLKVVHADDHAKLQFSERSDGSEFYDVEFRLWSAMAGDWRWYTSRSTALSPESDPDEKWITALRDIHDRKMGQLQRELVISEMRHRMQNLVAVISSLARHSNSTQDPAVDEFLTRFLGRLNAMGKAADLLLTEGRASIECGALVRRTLESFAGDLSQRFEISGPVVRMTEETGGSLGMAIHELATNAVKYGALSVPEGRIAITWSLTPQGDNNLFKFKWIERGSVIPVVPTRRGFGSRVIRAAAMRERQGVVELDYLSDGVRCEISFLRPVVDSSVSRPLVS